MTSTIPPNNKWDVQFRKGTLEMAILAALQAAPLYGLALLKRLHQFETMRITEGTLYPLLDRLKREGLIAAEWIQEGDSRPRKYYNLTDEGSDKLSELTARWQSAVQDVQSLLETAKTGKPNKGAK